MKKYGIPHKLFELLSQEENSSGIFGVAGEVRCQSLHRSQISKDL
jgi:hypothetical protein